jgi:large subunit ribosomal protein L28
VAGHCDVCGKTVAFGHNVSHSKRRTNRMFRPNVQRKKMLIGGKLTQIDICTRCLRTLGKDAR